METFLEAIHEFRVLYRRFTTYFECHTICSSVTLTVLKIYEQARVGIENICYI